MTHALLLVDDDNDFISVMAPALKRRGFDVFTASSVAEAEATFASRPFAFASIDLKMPGPSGLRLVPLLKQTNPAAQILVLTGYASIATAVEAIKLGACHYLAKPVNADDIVQALTQPPVASEEPALPNNPMTLDMHEWERIHQILQETDYNISKTAEKLGMHRRTLQRKLQKRQYR